jgi:hypothetical protein
MSNIQKLNRLATKLKSIYEKKRSTRKKNYKCASKFDNCWIKIAEVVDAMGADPALYIEAQFLIPGWTPNDGPPLPTQLYGEKAKDKYIKLKQLPESPYESAIKNQINYLSLLLNSRPYLTKDEILMDKKSPFSSFFRIIFCEQANYDLFFKKYGAEARKELEFEIGLNDHLKKKYATRYNRIFPERLSKSYRSSHTQDI